jgi:type IV pilus assembly protein PilE
MSKRSASYSLKAFTLTELLVVLAIIGILVLIALPNLMPLIAKAHSTEAKQNLGYLHSLEKAYYLENSKYSNDLKVLGFELEDPENAEYTYTVTSAGNTNYKAQATAKKDFDNDGTINVWEIDESKNLKEVTPD